MSRYMSVTRRFLGVSVLLVAAIGGDAAYADMVERTGKATVEYNSGAFSSKPSDESKHSAVEKAKKAAWDRFTADFDSSRMKAYKEVETEILHDLDKYIVDYSVSDELVDKESKRYTIVIRASINESAFEEKMRGVSGAGSSTPGSGGQFSFVFVAREAERAVSFDAKRTVVSEQENADKERQDDATSGDGGVVSGAHLKKTSINTSGGSIERKADQVSYRILSAEDVDASMTQVLSDSNFNVAKYVDVASECHGIELRTIQEGFAKTEEMAGDVRSSAIKAARECEVRFFAVGTLDSSMAEIDTVSGSKKVVVSVRAQVWNIEKRLPTIVASVGPVQYSGLGANADAARREALKDAAREAAKVIVNQLNAKSVR